MAVKLTILFQLTSNVTDAFATTRRIGGWSESWYQLGSDIPATIALARDGVGGGVGLLTSRARLLPRGGAIVGQRLQVVDPRGPAQSTAFGFPGDVNARADIPQMALLTRLGSVGTNNIRQHIIRGIPDELVFEGEFSPTAAYRSALNVYLSNLSPWRMRGRDLSLPTVKLFTISTIGAFTTETPHGLAPNDIVRISRTIDINGDFRGGRFMVETIGPGTNAGALKSWPHGLVNSGTIRKDAIVYPQIDITNASISRIVTRRVGRPFSQYRGRQSSRPT